MITLQALTRTQTGKASRTLLAEGKLPAVVYGPAKEAQNITVSVSDFAKILREEGESTVLEISGIGSSFQVLIQDIDRDPVTSLPRHADFYAIKKGAKVTVAVPLSFIGESPAVKAGANLVKVMHELEVEADPANLPHEIEIDITSLIEIGDQIHVKDVTLPAGVTTGEDEEEVIALVQEIKEEVEETIEAPDMAKIAVEQKGKAEEEAPTE